MAERKIKITWHELAEVLKGSKEGQTVRENKQLFTADAQHSEEEIKEVTLVKPKQLLIKVV